MHKKCKTNTKSKVIFTTYNQRYHLKILQTKPTLTTYERHHVENYRATSKKIGEPWNKVH